MTSPYCYVNLNPPPPPCPPLVIEMCTTEKVPVNVFNNTVCTFDLKTKFIRCNVDPAPLVDRNVNMNVDVNLLPTLQDRKIIIPISFTVNGSDTLNAGTLSCNVGYTQEITNKVGTSIYWYQFFKCQINRLNVTLPEDGEFFIAPCTNILFCPDCSSVTLEGESEELM